MDQKRFDKKVSDFCGNLKHMTPDQLMNAMVTVCKCAGWWYDYQKRKVKKLLEGDMK